MSLFAHNGTIKDVAFLRERASAKRQREIRSQTDSELFFAYLLTRLDEARLSDAEPCANTDAVLKSAVRHVRARPGFGACNFLLADATCAYAHRFGRTFYLLARNWTDAFRVLRETNEGVIVQTPSPQRRQAVLIASERATDR